MSPRVLPWRSPWRPPGVLVSLSLVLDEILAEEPPERTRIWSAEGVPGIGGSRQPDSGLDKDTAARTEVDNARRALAACVARVWRRLHSTAMRGRAPLPPASCELHVMLPRPCTGRAPSRIFVIATRENTRHRATPPALSPAARASYYQERYRFWAVQPKPRFQAIVPPGYRPQYDIDPERRDIDPEPRTTECVTMIRIKSADFS